MKNSGRKFKIGLLSISLLAIICTLTFLYFTAISSVMNFKKDIASLQVRLQELTDKSSKKENFNYELKYINYEIDQLHKVLPPNIEQERVILSLRRIEKASGAKITNIKFSQIEKAGSSNKSTSTANPQDEDVPTPTPSNSTKNNATPLPSPSPVPSPTVNNQTQNGSVTPQVVFADGDHIQMKVTVSFLAPYNELKNMLQEISREENRVVIGNISIQSGSDNSKILSGTIDLTFHALKDSTRSFDDWQLQMERGNSDLFMPFDGYSNTDDVILPTVDDQSKTMDAPSDFYLIASQFNDVKPAVLIGKYDSINSEISFDGNNTIDVNFYVEEKNGQLYYRTRTKQNTFPDATNSKIFFPKKDDITMNIVSSPIASITDNVRVNFHVYNNTSRNMTIYTDNSSERVSIDVKQGNVQTAQKDQTN